MTSIVLLIILLGHNLYWAHEINTTARTTDRLRWRSRSLWKLAVDNRDPSVSGRLAIYYRLEQLIGGATVTLPPVLAGDAWGFERIARLEPELSDAPLLVDPVHDETLRREGRPWSMRWCITCRRGRTQRFRGVYFLIVPGARDYVIAESLDEQSFYVMTAARYDEVASR